MKVMIAGGGTAGHINPGLAIAKYIKSRDENAEILFVGTKHGMETRLVPREGFNIELIKVRGFRRKLSMDTLKALKELCQGLFQARRLIKKFKPDIVIGTGGYVCGPVVFNAARMKIPTLIHEQNALPGVTNKILSRFVKTVAISFKESEQYFMAAKNLVYTGNPVRGEILTANKKTAREKLKIASQKQLVVIVGGSLGAQRINEAVVDMIQKYHQSIHFSLIFATGNNQYEAVAGRLKGFQLPDLKVVPYIYDAADTYASADLMVCRAGAITCSELTALGLPSVMIPSPNVTANHQEHNARALENQGAAVVILDKDLNGDLLYRQISELLEDKEQLAKMGRNAKKMSTCNASEKLFDLVQKLLKSS